MITILYTIAFFALFGIVNGLRTRELNGENTNRTWHKVQSVMHVLFALFAAWQFGFSLKALVCIPAVLAVVWVVFDIAHNLTTGEDWHYHEDAGMNGWLKKRVRVAGVLIIKAILLTSLIFIFLWL